MSAFSTPRAFLSRMNHYYRVAEPDVTKRYPDEHAVLLSIRNHHCGPWEEWGQLPDWLLTELEKKQNGSA